MKRIIYIIILFITLVGCTTGRINKKELLQQNKKLIVINDRLNDSINNLISHFKYDSVTPVLSLTDIPHVVYRGMRNKLNISLSGATTIDVISETGKMSKQDSSGNFEFTPSKGRNVPIIIKAKMLDGSIKKFKDTLKIKDARRTKTSLDGYSGKIKMTKGQFKNGLVRGYIDDYLYNHKFVLSRFKIKLPNQETISVEGDVITEDIYNNISKNVSVGDEIYIYGLHNILKGFRGCIKNPMPLHIEIIED